MRSDEVAWPACVGLAVPGTPLIKAAFDAAHSPLPWAPAFLVTLLLIWLTWALIVKPLRGKDGDSDA
jgi:hypothetical protein